MIYRIIVPAEHTLTARQLLTEREIKNAIKDGTGLIVRLSPESEARAFTEMLRDATGAVLAFNPED